jgi:hypothetical protein
LFCSAVVSFLLRNIAGALRRHFVFEVPIRRFLIRRFFPHFCGIPFPHFRGDLFRTFAGRRRSTFAFSFCFCVAAVSTRSRTTASRFDPAIDLGFVPGSRLWREHEAGRKALLSSAGQDRTMPRAFRSTNRTSLRGATLSIFGVSFTWSPQGLCATSREAHGLSVLRPVRNALSRGKGRTGFGRARA